MGLSLAAAFDTRPLGTLVLGGREFPVPPLTFGRFQRLLALDMGQLVVAIPEFAAEALVDVVKIVAPDIDLVAWREMATEPDVAKVFLMFAKGHDWQFIADSIEFGKTPDPSKRDAPTPTELTSALLSFCRANPAYSIESLLDMRLEGFYLLVAAQKEINEARAGGVASGDGMAPDGVTVETASPERAAALTAMLDAAEGRVRG